jgi:hypothetical protein
MGLRGLLWRQSGWPGSWIVKRGSAHRKARGKATQSQGLVLDSQATLAGPPWQFIVLACPRLNAPLMYHRLCLHLGWGIN